MSNLSEKNFKGKNIALRLLFPDKFTALFPNLAICLDTGTIVIIDTVYVGKASDGKEVHIGMIDEEKQVESYLTSNPTPNTW